MAVQSIHQLRNKSGTWKMNSHSYTFNYDIFTDGDGDEIPTVAGFVVNYINTQLSGYTYNGTTLDTVTCSQIENANNPNIGRFRATATFETLNYWERSQRTQNPTDRPALVKGQTREVEVVADYDVSGNPIYNTAGDPFVPAPTRRMFQSVIHATRNYIDYTQNLADSLKGTTNNSPLFGFGPNTLLCVDVVPEPMTEIMNNSGTLTAYDFTQVTFSFESNTLYSWGWQTAILNKGLRQLVGGKKQPCYVDTTQQSIEASESVFLAADGSQLPTGTPAGTSQILNFQIYPATDFSSFNLDS